MNSLTPPPKINVCIDTTIILITVLEPEFFSFGDNSGGHLGSHLGYFHSKFFEHLILIRNEFLTPPNLYIGTKIILLTAPEQELFSISEVIMVSILNFFKAKSCG